MAEGRVRERAFCGPQAAISRAVGVNPSALALLLVSAVAVLTAAQPSGGTCSLIPFATARDSAATYFVGRAQPETVRVGPSGARTEPALGNLGGSTTIPAFGQVVRVERVAGNDSTALERTFTRLASRDVVVVPWDYDPACAPLPWRQGALWVRDTSVGFYRVRTRPESLWVGGRPVADAFHAAYEPYPHGRHQEAGSRVAGGRRPWLTPDEYFDLVAVLPTGSRLARDRIGAARALDDWEHRHPELVGRYPATEMLRFARAMLSR